jgi:hypothetical protein
LEIADFLKIPDRTVKSRCMPRGWQLIERIKEIDRALRSDNQEQGLYEGEEYSIGRRSTA